MKTNIQLIFTIVFLAIIPSIFADTDANELKKRKLIVEILSEDKDALKALQNDPEKLATYKKSVADYNVFLKRAVEKFWKCHKTVEYKTLDEVNALKVDKVQSKNYAALECVKMIASKGVVFNYSPFYFDGFDDKKSKARRSVMRIVYLDKIAREYVGKLERSSQYMITGLQEFDFPSEADLIIGVQYLNNEFLRQDAKNGGVKKAHSMAGKTLLLDEEKVEKNVSFESFPFPVKLVSKKEIDNAIISADPKYACITTMLSLSEWESQTALSEWQFKYLVYTEDCFAIGTTIGPYPITQSDIKEWAKQIKKESK